MRIVVANTAGKLENGRHVVPFPSRWCWSGGTKPFAYYSYELAYLSTLLKRELPAGQVVMVDGNYEQLDPEAYAVRLRALEPDVIVTECSALTYSAMTRAVQAVRAANPDLRALLAGPAGMAWPARAQADGWEVVHGEYEHKVLARLRGEAEPAGFIDLDWLPWPEDEDIQRINYGEWSNLKPGLVQVFPTRGCPLACTFCVVPSYYGGHGHSGRSHRTRAVDDVCDELQYLADKYHGRFQGAFFNEEAHNADPGWLERFARALIDHQLNNYFWDAMCGYWTLTEPLVALMKQAGYGMIRIGIESLDEGVGRRIGKRVIPDKLYRILEWCRAHGIAVYGTTQIGAQGSTRAIDLATLEVLVRLRDEGLIWRWQHPISTPQPGTPFFDEVKAAELLLTEDWTLYDGKHAIVNWPDYPPAEVERVFRQYQQAR